MKYSGLPDSSKPADAPKPPRRFTGMPTLARPGKSGSLELERGNRLLRKGIRSDSKKDDAPKVAPKAAPAAPKKKLPVPEVAPRFTVKDFVSTHLSE